MERKIPGEADMSPTGRTPGSTFWLIAGRTQTEMFVIEVRGRVTLPVFSFREEAEMFLESEAVGDWRVRETGSGELVSLLAGSCAGAGYVALDPLPRRVSGEALDLVSMDRERFVASIVNRRKCFSGSKPNGHSEARTSVEGFRRRSATFRRTIGGSR